MLEVDRELIRSGAREKEIIVGEPEGVYVPFDQGCTASTFLKFLKCRASRNEIPKSPTTCSVRLVINNARALFFLVERPDARGRASAVYIYIHTTEKSRDQYFFVYINSVVFHFSFFVG
jgi:hypothetical protein